MKESIGGMSLFMLVIALIVIFTGIMTFTINRSNSFAIKDEILSIIESDGGFDMKASYNYDTGTGNATLKKIVETIGAHEYRQTGPCPEASEGVEVACYDRTGNSKSSGEQATIIILKKRGSQTIEKKGTTEPYYFETRVYYRIDLPILNNILIFHVDGQTKALYTGATK